jgi:hypothetical protein
MGSGPVISDHVMITFSSRMNHTTTIICGKTHTRKVESGSPEIGQPAVVPRFWNEELVWSRANLSDDSNVAPPKSRKIN